MPFAETRDSGKVLWLFIEEGNMGKGDPRTKRGKIAKGSNGNTRPKGGDKQTNKKPTKAKK